MTQQDGQRGIIYISRILGKHSLRPLLRICGTPKRLPILSIFHILLLATDQRVCHPKITCTLITCSFDLISMAAPAGSQSFQNAIQHTPPQIIWAAGLDSILNGKDVLSDCALLQSPAVRDTNKRKSRRSRKHRSKKSKKRRNRRVHGYVLQMIGIACLVLAAIKAFEPLTGVGFTLILIGYNTNAKKSSRVGK